MSYIYSVIIPHRNIPQLLVRCLASIPQREDLEVIIVDDNSDPETVDFDSFPGKERPNTTIVFDKSGKGAGRARNIGMEMAKGKWLLFADADDFFNYCLNAVLDEYELNESDMVFFPQSCLDSETYINGSRADMNVKLLNNYISKKKYSELLLRYILAAPWGKLIKNSLVHNNHILFEETKIHNDVRFSYLVGFYAKTIKVDMRAIYCLTYRAGSITYTLSEEKILDRMRVFARRDSFLKEKNIVLPEDYCFYLETLVDLVNRGEIELYNRCMQVLSEFGVSRSQVESKVNLEIVKRKQEAAYRKRGNLYRFYKKVNSIISKLWVR